MGVRQPRGGWFPQQKYCLDMQAVGPTGLSSALVLPLNHPFLLAALSVVVMYSCVLNSLSVSVESRECDANFVVASLFIDSVSLSLLEHQEQTAGAVLDVGQVEEEAADDEEPQSISVPVHGLGTVSVRSAPVSAR